MGEPRWAWRIGNIFLTMAIKPLKNPDPLRLQVEKKVLRALN
jgi:hypothetical protein